MLRTRENTTTITTRRREKKRCMHIIYYCPAFVQLSFHFSFSFYAIPFNASVMRITRFCAHFAFRSKNLFCQDFQHRSNYECSLLFWQHLIFSPLFALCDHIWVHSKMNWEKKRRDDRWGIERVRENWTGAFAFEFGVHFDSGVQVMRVEWAWKGRLVAVMRTLLWILFRHFRSSSCTNFPATTATASTEEYAEKYDTHERRRKKYTQQSMWHL